MEVSWQAWTSAIADGVRGVPDEALRDAALLLGGARLVLTAGNGGSHALASHAAQALCKPHYAAGGGVAAVCLTDAVPTLTAHANDGGWISALEEVARPFLQGHRGNADTCMLLFSSSGRSPNMVRLAQAAQVAGCPLVTFTGFSGAPLRQAATIAIHVESQDYEVVEPVHDALLHRLQYHLRTTRR